jgi:hypothetical protein
MTRSAAALAPRLLVAFDERRERFPNAASMQKFAGIAPVTERSGNKSWVHWRYACPKFLRQTFVEWAAQTIPLSYWAKAFYEQQRARGARHQAALRALAFKWSRILHRCWVDRVPYDEARYLLALKKRQSPAAEVRRADAIVVAVFRLRSASGRELGRIHTGLELEARRDHVAAAELENLKGALRHVAVVALYLRLHPALKQELRGRRNKPARASKKESVAGAEQIGGGDELVEIASE